MDEPADAPFALELQEVSLVKGRRAIVDGVTLRVRRGEVLALVGRNGAGKTSTLRVLTGLERPTKGRIVRNHAPRALGYCPQQDAVYPELTCLENLVQAAALHNVPATRARATGRALLAALGLADKADAHAEHLSGGMRRRLTLALAFVHEPEVVAIEEPEAGLDPTSKLAVERFLRARPAGQTLIVSTHDLGGLAQLADRVAILEAGRLVALCAPGELARWDYALPGGEEPQGEMAFSEVAPSKSGRSARLPKRLFSPAVRGVGA